MSKYIITDWANNIMCYDSKLRTPFLAVPKEFNSFDDAECFLVKILKNSYDDFRGEYYIIKQEGLQND